MKFDHIFLDLRTVDDGLARGVMGQLSTVSRNHDLACAFRFLPFIVPWTECPEKNSDVGPSSADTKAVVQYSRQRSAPGRQNFTATSSLSEAVSPLSNLKKS